MCFFEFLELVNETLVYLKNLFRVHGDVVTTNEQGVAIFDSLMVGLFLTKIITLKHLNVSLVQLLVNTKHNKRKISHLPMTRHPPPEKQAFP